MKILTLAAILLAAAAIGAQTATFVATPTAALSGALVYDPHRNVVVVFEWSGTIWEWDGTRSRARLGVAHGASDAGVYDPLHREILTSYGMWNLGAWNGSSWRMTGTPNGWSLGAMAFDVARQRLVRVFSAGTPDVAEWNGQQWTRITPPASPGIGGSLAYDPTRGCCVLAIGNPVSLWTWEGSQWSLLDGSGPAATGTFGVWFDPGANRLVVHGGSTNPPSSGTWAFDASGWTTIATPTSFAGPSSWPGMNLAWDGIGLLRLGLRDARPEGIWRLEGNVWRQLPIDLPQVRDSAAFASTPSRAGLLLFGGYLYDGISNTYFADTWILDGVWTRQIPAHAPSPRHSAGLAWSPTNQAFVLFGGVDAQGSTLLDTWTWDGTDWTQQTPASTPTAALQLVTDPLGGVLGLRRTTVGTTNDQWLWNGTTWINQPSLGATQAQAKVTAAYDPHRNFVVAAVDTQHWEWNGSAWTQIGAMPSAWNGDGLATYRPDTQRILFLGTQATFAPLLEWDGTTWTNTFGNLWLPGTLAPDYARSRLVIFPDPWWGSPNGMLTPTPATAQRFGYGCALGPSPGLLTDGRPIPDEPDFGIAVTALAANAPCVLALGFTVQGQHLGSGCVSWIQQPPAVHFLVADAAGRARLPLPIPADLNLRGVTFVAQTAVLDPPRGLFGGLTFSDGLRITIGD